LENFIGRAIINMKINDTIIQENHLPQFERLAEKGEMPVAYNESYENMPLTLEDIIEQAEKRYIVQVIRECNNNKTKAARLMGISLRSLYYKLEKYGID